MPDPSEPVGVLFVNTDLRVGGMERALVRVLERLDRTRIRPVVACLKEPGTLAPKVEAAGVPLHAHLSKGRLDPMVLWRLRSLVRRERIQVVCTVGCGDKMFWGRLAGRLGGASGIVSTIHKTRNPDGSPVIERSNRLLMGITDRFVAVARQAADYLIEHEGLPAERVTVIYNGIDPDEFTGEGRAEARQALGLPESAPVVAQVAVLRPEKGHDTTLRAAERLKERFPDLQVLFAGEGAERASIEAEIDRRGLGRNVRLLGEVSDIPQLLAAADVFVLSSQARVETFPNSVLEAMGSRLPVVATHVGSISEQVLEGETGHLVPEGDDTLLAERLASLFEDPERARAMGAAGRERVIEHFSVARMVRDREQLFLELAGRS